MSDTSSAPSVLWTYIRGITQFQRTKQNKQKLFRGGNRDKWSYTNADSFIHKYTTRNFGEISEDSDCELIESDLEECIDGEWESQTDDWWTYVVKPDGKFIHYWLFFVSLAVLYYLWFLVARETWLVPPNGFWISIDMVCDLIFFLDIFVQSRTGYLEHGILVTDTKRLLKRYRRTLYCAGDVLALFPSMLIYLAFFQSLKNFRPFLKLPRFLKIYRARQFLLKVESAAPHPNGVRIFNLVHFLFLLTHCFAAVHFHVSREIGFGSDDWVYPDLNGTEDDRVSRQYLASFYWSTITLTTIGDIPEPKNNWEFVIQILGYMLGIFVFATIVGQVGTVVENRNSMRLAFERHVDQAKRYMREHKVPSEVQKPIMRWYEYTWTRGQMEGRGDVNCLGLLPTKLRTELALHVNLKTLKKVSFFKRCQPAFLHDLVLKMQLNVITPGEVLCRKGEVAREVFIVSDGLLDVIGKRGKIIRRLETGDFFGEIGAMVSEDATNRRAVDVRSVGYSELFTISKEDIVRLLKDHPQAKKVLEDTARSYNFNRSRRRTRRRNNSRRTVEIQTFSEENERDKEGEDVDNSISLATERDAEPADPVDQRPPKVDHLTVPQVKLRPGRSVKRKKQTDRSSLRFIPEGTTKKRQSHYRRLSETPASGGADTRSGSSVSSSPRGVARKVHFNTNRNSTVEIPEDIATVVELKMDQLSENFKSLLAYTRVLEEKVQILTGEKESLEAELMEQESIQSIHVDEDVDDTSL